jgi:DNA-directed RNA polymerase specialized sigma24 family protein
VPTLDETRESLVEFSRRFSRVAHEVEDLAHDVILSALRRGAPLDGEAFLRSAPAAARRHAAFLARGALRRRTRELLSTREPEASGDVTTDDEAAHGAPLSALSATLRTTLYLLCSGLEKAELRLALGVTDAALRKRFQALRELAPLARPRRTRTVTSSRSTKTVRCRADAS